MVTASHWEMRHAVLVIAKLIVSFLELHTVFSGFGLCVQILCRVRVCKCFLLFCSAYRAQPTRLPIKMVQGSNQFVSNDFFFLLNPKWTEWMHWREKKRACHSIMNITAVKFVEYLVTCCCLFLSLSVARLLAISLLFNLFSIFYLVWEAVFWHSLFSTIRQKLKFTVSNTYR